MKRVGKDGRTRNTASEHKWGEWQVPPVICPACGDRVTLKQAFFGSFTKGTFHAACYDPNTSTPHPTTQPNPKGEHRDA